MLTRIVDRFLDLMEWTERAERHVPWLGSGTARWDRISRLGRRRFVLTMGVGYFGATMLALTLILQYFGVLSLAGQLSLGYVLYSAVVWLTLGYVWGTLMWYIMTRFAARKRQRATAAQDAP